MKEFDVELLLGYVNNHKIWLYLTFICYSYTKFRIPFKILDLVHKLVMLSGRQISKVLTLACWTILFFCYQKAYCDIRDTNFHPFERAYNIKVANLTFVEVLNGHVYIVKIIYTQHSPFFFYDLYQLAKKILRLLFSPPLLKSSHVGF